MTSHIYSYFLPNAKAKSHALTRKVWSAFRFSNMLHTYASLSIFASHPVLSFILPSRVQSPGSFEQKSLITRPSVVSSCSWIQLHWMSNSCCGERSNQAVNNLHINLNSNQFRYHIHPHPMTGLGWQVIFINISCQTPSRNLMHWHKRCGVLSGSQTCCTPMQACHSLPVIQFSALFTLPSSVTRLFWAKEPYNSAFCLVIMQLDSTWLDVKFMLRRTQQSSSQQFIH